jgi:hypothetical protein
MMRTKSQDGLSGNDVDDLGKVSVPEEKEVIETEDTYQGIEFGIFNFKHLQIVISFNTLFELADEERKGEEGLNY